MRRETKRLEREMSTVTNEPEAKQSVADEADARHSEALAAEARGRNLSLYVALTVLAALVGGVIALALSGGIGNGTTVVRMPMNGTGASNMPGQMSGGMMSGAGGGSKAATPNTSSHPVVSSSLGEYWIHPSTTSVPAGKVEFMARNVGQVTHELMVERAPIKMDGPGQPNEDAALGMIQDMAPGASGKMTLNLKPGMYMLFCNITGHFAAGQHTMLRVTG
jgi:uncharacterized cupredoxin-like copper-binding protein